MITAGFVTSAWAGAASVASGSPALNTGSSQVVFNVTTAYLPSPATVDVTLTRHGSTAPEDVIVGSGSYSAGKVTATLNFSGANPGKYDATLSQLLHDSDSCSECVTVNAFKPAVTSVTPATLGLGTTGTGYQPFVVNGQNFTKGPYGQCSSDSCTGPSVAVYRTGTSTPDTNVTLSATRNADDTGDAPTPTTSSSITLRVDIEGPDTATYVDDVVVTNSDGKSSRCAGCLTIKPQPVVTSVLLQAADFPGAELAHIGQNATGQTVVVRGDNFPDDARVYWLRPDSAGPSETINIGSASDPLPDGDHQKIVLTNVSTTAVATLGDASGNNSWRAIVSSAALRSSSDPVPFPVTAAPAASDLALTDSSTGAYGQGAQDVQVDATITNGVAGASTADTSDTDTPHTVIRFTDAAARSWVTGDHSATTTHALATLDIPESATTGGHTFRVVNPDGGTSAVCDNGDGLLTPNTCLLTVGTGPKVTSLSPSSAAPGGSVPVTISGTGFHTGANAVAVRVGPADTPVFSDNTVTPTNATTIPITLDLTGVDSPQDLDVVVTNNDDRGTGTKSAGFHVVNFTVSSITPDSSTNDDSVPTVIAGASFPDDVSVKLAMTGVPDINGTITASDADSIDATFDLTDRAPGVYELVVTSPTEGTATKANAFTVQALPPSIDNVTPSAVGAGATDVAVTITGSNIYDGATVTFSNAGVHPVGAADVTAPDTVVQHISVDSDATTGAGTVSVTNTDGQTSGTKPFTVNAGPSVDTISPDPVAAGQTINDFTVNGSGFQPDAELDFSVGSISTSNLVVNGAGTQITADVTVPGSVTSGGAPVEVEVAVVNGDGGRGASPEDLTVVPPPSIDSLDPSRAANTWAPFTLTVTGDHFADGATLTSTDGQLDISAVTVDSANTIHATVDASGATVGNHGIKVDNGGEAGSDTASLAVFTKPTAPRNVAARSRDRALLVSWTIPASNGGDAVISYTATLLRHSTGSPVASYTTPSAAVQSHKFGGLTNGVLYDVRVVATNHAGNSPAGTTSARPKYATKLTIHRSAKAVDSGHRVTLSGKLTRSDGTPLAGRKVAVFRTKFTVTKRIGTVTTNSRGKWSLTFTPKRTAKYQARFAGDRKDRPSASDTVRIRVRR